MCICGSKFRKEYQVMEHSKTCVSLYGAQHIKHCYREATIIECVSDLLLSSFTLTIFRCTAALYIWNTVKSHLGINLGLVESILFGASLGVIVAVTNLKK